MKCASLILFLVFALSPFSAAHAAGQFDLEATGDHSVWVITNDVRNLFEKETGIKLNLIPELAIVGKGCEKGILHAEKGKPDRQFGLICCALDDRTINNHNLKLYPVAREPLAIIVNKKNPVKSLTLRQVKEIFAGKITNWKEVGGADEKIVVMTQLHCKQFTPNWMGILNRPERFTKNRLDIKTQPEMAKSVADFPQAIGHLEMTSVRESGDIVKIIAVDGSMPTSENMRGERYPFYALLSVATSGEASGKVLDFIRFMRKNPGVAKKMEKYGMTQEE